MLGRGAGRHRRQRIGQDLASQQAKLGQSKQTAIKTEGSSLDKTASAWGVESKTLARYIMIALTLLFDPAAFWLVSAASMLKDEKPEAKIETIAPKSEIKATRKITAKLPKSKIEGTRPARPYGVPALGRSLKQILEESKITLAR